MTGDKTDSAPCFRFGLLNNLRDELMLTITRQKVTFFHFLYLLIPMMAIMAGYLWGDHAKSSAKMILGCLLGCVLGVWLAGALPRALSSLLRLFIRKGWFLYPEPPSPTSLMTAEQFTSRQDALMQSLWSFNRLWLFYLMVAASVAYLAISYLEKIDPPSWVGISAVILMLSAFACIFRLRQQAWKRTVQKYGLQCPTCLREITGVAGMSCLPSEGRCRHCGTKVIDVPDEAVSVESRSA